MKLEKMIGSAAAEIVKQSKINCVVLLTKKDDYTISAKIVREGKKENRLIKIEPMPSGTITQIRMIIRKIVDSDSLKKGDSVICLVGESLGIGFEGLFLFFNIDQEFIDLTTIELKKELKKSVYEAVLEIAREISKEGREGRNIGTAFIVGDHKKY